MWNLWSRWHLLPKTALALYYKHFHLFGAYARSLYFWRLNVVLCGISFISTQIHIDYAPFPQNHTFSQDLTPVFSFLSPKTDQYPSALPFCACDSSSPFSATFGLFISFCPILTCEPTQPYTSTSGPNQPLNFLLCFCLAAHSSLALIAPCFASLYALCT